MLTKEDAIDIAKKAARDMYGIESGTFKYLGGGSYGKAVLVTGGSNPERFVVKSYLINGMHLSERKELETLKSVSTIPVPEVYFSIDKGGEYAFDCLGMEFMEGITPFGAAMFKSRKKRKALAIEVADCLENIHSLTSPNGKFGSFDNPEFDTWEEYYKFVCSKIVKMADKLLSGGIIDDKICGTVKAAYGKYDEIFKERARRVSFVHGDLNVFNLFVDKKTLKATSIFDPYNSMWADETYDLFQFRNFPDAAGLFKESVKRVPQYEMLYVRIAFYALFNEIKCAYDSGNTLKFLLRRQTKFLRREMKKKNLL